MVRAVLRVPRGKGWVGRCEAEQRAVGSIEQDADIVLFIYRDELYNPESDQRGLAEIIIAKHRNGPVGSTRLVFHGDYTSFENAARE